MLQLLAHLSDSVACIDKAEKLQSRTTDGKQMNLEQAKEAWQGGWNCFILLGAYGVLLGIQHVRSLFTTGSGTGSSPCRRFEAPTIEVSKTSKVFSQTGTGLNLSKNYIIAIA